MIFQAIARDFDGNNLLTCIEHSIEDIRNRAFQEFSGWDACHRIDIWNLVTGELIDQIENLPTKAAWEGGNCLILPQQPQI